jgi:hypothetical protein
MILFAAAGVRWSGEERGKKKDDDEDEELGTWKGLRWEYELCLCCGVRNMSA